jgi:hypothetical protein
MDYYSINSRTLNQGKLLTHILPEHYDTIEHDILSSIYETEGKYRRPGLQNHIKDFIEKALIP